MATHVIERTSPKGEVFFGTCRLCGQAGLRPTDAHKECENVRGLTNGEAVMEAIDGHQITGQNTGHRTVIPTFYCHACKSTSVADATENDDGSLSVTCPRCGHGTGQ